MDKRLYKVCRCCGFETYQMRKRKCPTCGVPAIWDQHTDSFERVQARDERNARFEALLNELVENP